MLFLCNSLQFATTFINQLSQCSAFSIYSINMFLHMASQTIQCIFSRTHGECSCTMKSIMIIT